MNACVYILRCRDGSYYVGSTRGALEKRISEHDTGVFDGYTSLRRPLELVFSESFERITDAIAAERKIKGWSRAKKKALIEGDFERLRELSRRRGLHPSRRDLAVAPQDEDDMKAGPHPEERRSRVSKGAFGGKP